MTDRERIRVAKIDMFKLMKICEQIQNQSNAKAELIISLYGSGMDYSKDRVQTTPRNAMEEVFARASECENRIDELIESRGHYLKKIYALKKDRGVNVLIDKYVMLKSFRRIAKENNKSVSYVHEIHDKALIDYFNTNCCSKS